MDDADAARVLQTLQQRGAAAAGRRARKLYAAAAPALAAAAGAGSANLAAPQVSQALVAVCAAFVARDNTAKQKGVTLPVLLAAAGGATMVDFLVDGEVVLLKVTNAFNDEGADVAAALQELKQLKVQFVCAGVLREKYVKLFASVLRGPEDRTEPVVALGWLLFCVAKRRLLAQSPDMFMQVHLLLAVLSALAAAAPPDLEQLLPDVVAAGASSAGGGAAAALAALVKGNAADVTALYEQLEAVTATLPRLPLLGDAAATSAQADSLHAAYGESVMATSDLDERLFHTEPEALGNAARLKSAAASGTGSATPVRGVAMTPRRQAAVLPSPLRSAVGAGALGLPPPSPAARTPLGLRTPVSEAMAASQWLRNVVGRRAKGPSSPGLRRFLDAARCTQDLPGAIHARAEELAACVFQTPPEPAAAPPEPRGTSAASAAGGLLPPGLESAAVMVNRSVASAQQRRVEALQLYYHALEAILVQEEQRLRGTAGEETGVESGASSSAAEPPDLTTLLTSATFHKTLLCVALEVVAASYKVYQLAFPAVPERMGLKPFDLCKVIEPFVRNEPTLPRELIRHLNSLEERIVESLAFERGSSLYTVLLAARVPPDAGGAASTAAAAPSASGSTGAPETVAAEAGAEMQPPLSPISLSRTRSAFAVVLSPRQQRDPAASVQLPAAFGPPDSPCPEGVDEASHRTLHFFLKSKVMRLAALRCMNMCERLHLPPVVLGQVYATMRHVVYERTALLYNRHLDHLLLCAVYGVCKVNAEVDVKFKDIITQYKRLPQCRTDVIRSVVLEQSTTADLHVTARGDIIEFYNRVFIQELKAFLFELNAREPAPTPPAQAALPEVPEFPMHSPLRVTRGTNVYVSPLRSAGAAAARSNTRTLYAFVGESTHAYQSPSKDLSFINGRMNSRVGTDASADTASDAALQEAAAAAAAAAVSSYSRMGMSSPFAVHPSPTTMSKDEPPSQRRRLDPEAA